MYQKGDVIVDLARQTDEQRFTVARTLVPWASAGERVYAGSRNVEIIRWAEEVELYVVHELRREVRSARGR